MHVHDAFLFVYGTLMRGECRHHYLASSATFVRDAEVHGQLVHLGEYPGLIPGESGIVRGELYAVPNDLLAVLDAMEGDEYERVRIAVGTDEAWTYRVVNPGEVPVIPTGSWRVQIAVTSTAEPEKLRRFVNQTGREVSKE